MTTTACTVSTRIAAAALVVLAVLLVVVAAVLTTSTSQPLISAVLPSSGTDGGHVTTTTAIAATVVASSNAIHNRSITRRATPLARRTTSLPDKAPVATREAGGMQINMLVVPEHKLMWCRIDKVAGSTVANIINLVRARHPSTPPDAATFLLTGHSSPRIKAIMEASHADNRFSEQSRRTTVGSPILDIKSAHELALLMADPEWTKVVVFRDPVERFLSAFISECERNHDPTVNCVYNSAAAPGDTHVSLPDFVAAARKDIAQNKSAARLFGNAHWRVQTAYCGGLSSRSGLPYYNVRAQYRSHTFGSVVEDALQRAGVAAEVRDEVQVRVLGDAKQWLAPEGSATHRTQAGSKLCKYFRSEEEVAEVASWYAGDYRAFAALGMKSGVEYYREVCGKPPRADTSEAGAMQIHMLVVPEHKLMWCRIDKVAGSTVANIMNLVRARHPSTPPDAATFLLTGHRSPRIKAIMDDSHIHSRFSEQSRRTTVGSPILDVNTTQEVAHLMADPEWTKVVVFRDPVERFLSAFISKCEPNHDPTSNCVYMSAAARGHKYVSFPDFVAAARQEIAKYEGTAYTARLFRNVHWRKQSLYCGGLTNATGLSYYNVRAQYRSHTFGGVVEDALQRAGVAAEVRDEVQVKVLGDPKHGAALEGSATHRTQAGSKLCKYFTSEEMVAEVASWYAEDYRAFASLGMKSGVEYYREVCGTSV